MEITDKEFERFNKEGFIILDGALSREDLESFRSSLIRTIQAQIDKAASNNEINLLIEKGKECESGLMALERFNHEIVADISDFMDKSPEVLRLVSAAPVYKNALKLLGLDINAPAYITNCGIVLAMPFDRDYSYGWHKDTYYTLPYSKYIQMWAPLLEDSTAELGTLEVCVGSHLVGLNEQHAVNGVPNRHKYRANPEALVKYTKRKIELNLGQVLLFHSGLAHRSGKNISNRPRFSLVSVYHQVENSLIRPIAYSGSFKGVEVEEYFREFCGETRLPDDENHFS